MGTCRRCPSALAPLALVLVSTAASARPDVTGYVQTDAVLHDQAAQDQLDQDGQPLNTERVLVRRARVRLLEQRASGAGLVELDANTVHGGQARVVAAEVSARWPARATATPAEAAPGAGAPVAAPTRPALALVEAALGLFKIPFGRETQEVTERRVFLEPSTMVRALFPGERDLGLEVRGAWRFARWQLAAMNGDPIGERVWPAQDANAAKDVVGRAGVDVEVTSALRLAAGVSGLRGRGLHPGSPSTKDVLVWRDSNQNGVVESPEIQVISGRAASPSIAYDRFALGADVELRAQLRCWGSLLVHGELIWAQNLDRGVEPADPVAAGRDLRELGFSVGASVELHERWLGGVRWDRYDPDADAREQQGASVVGRNRAYETVALLVGARFAGFGLASLQYEFAQDHLGRGISGTPTSRRADRLTLRAQVSF